MIAQWPLLLEEYLHNSLQPTISFCQTPLNEELLNTFNFNRYLKILNCNNISTSFEEKNCDFHHSNTHEIFYQNHLKLNF